MEKFDINTVIECYNLNTEDLAKVLFPNVKYPKQAFDRILKNEACLDIEQVQTLASYLGVMVHDLFAVDTWKATSEDGYLTFIKGKFKVKLNYNNTFLVMYKDDKKVHDEIINNIGLPMKDFINHINNLIKKYSNGSN